MVFCFIGRVVFLLCLFPAEYAAGMTQMSPIGFDKQQREDNIADAAGKPDGDKQGDKHSRHKLRAPVGFCVHQHMAGGCPGADQNVQSMGIFCPGQKECDYNTQYRRRINKPPFLDESQMRAGLMIVLKVFLSAAQCSRFFRLRGMALMKGRMRGNGCAENAFADVWDNAVAQGSNPDRADISDYKDQDEFLPFGAVETERRSPWR